MSRYLSATWFDEVARHNPPAAPGQPLIVLGQVVTGTPTGEVRYSVVVDAIGARLVEGREPAPQVTFTTDWVTAHSVASGAMSMQSALTAGKVRVGGDVGLLSEHQGALARLDPVPAEVRERTSWGDDGR